VVLNAAAAGTMDGGAWASARSGADDCSANGKPILCLLPPSANDQRGEGRSLQLPFIKFILDYYDYYKYT